MISALLQATLADAIRKALTTTVRTTNDMNDFQYRQHKAMQRYTGRWYWPQFSTEFRVAWWYSPTYRGLSDADSFGAYIGGGEL